MKQLGFTIKVVAPEVCEDLVRGEPASVMVRRLAKEKALAVIKRLTQSDRNLYRWVLAADTCVVAPNAHSILGKPVDRKDAVRMLAKIQGRVHTVYTGFCWAWRTQTGHWNTHTRVVSSRVEIARLTRSQITDYVNTGEPMDKAGAYAAQGIGMSFIRRIVGSYSNVVGLPLCEVREDFERLLRENS